MRTVAVRALPIAPGAELRGVATWRALPEVGAEVSVVRLDGEGGRWRATVSEVDAERGTYSVIVGEAKG